MTFTAPDPATLKPPEWATYVETRHPQFKLHKRKSDATCAVRLADPWHYGRKRGGVLYRVVNGAWVEIERVEQG